MAKVILGAAPKNFKHTVKINLLDGTKAEIKALFKYRTKSEFGAFMDQLFADAGEEKTKDEKFSMAETLANVVDKNADYLLDILDGWDIDDELNRDNLQRLSNELPGAAAALMDAYRLAITEGRLGN